MHDCPSCADICFCDGDEGSFWVLNQGFVCEHCEDFAYVYEPASEPVGAER